MRRSSKVLVILLIVAGVAGLVLQHFYGGDLLTKPPFGIAGVLLLQMGMGLGITLSDGSKIPRVIVPTCLICVCVLFI
ncbi:MAG: hypothetical protein UW95_C0030G0008 [Parcubacteria group bacterium GW2011_GWC1_45_14]|nr:MAG: hypothetical protein UW87_C0015G0011 [Candidatus Moranbacteria bacterium GW2011_GWC2_45_10]KKT92693.1 MAG: hypothetical protein UW95_C0030G0008 [Parcubacteria group bacterium GW2011_GWC1_45_14]